MEDETAGRRTFPELPGWIFRIDETSACVYTASGVDRNARIVGVQVQIRTSSFWSARWLQSPR